MLPIPCLKRLNLTCQIGDFVFTTEVFLNTHLHVVNNNLVFDNIEIINNLKEIVTQPFFASLNNIPTTFGASFDIKEISEIASNLTPDKVLSITIKLVGRNLNKLPDYCFHFSPLPDTLKLDLPLIQIYASSRENLMRIIKSYEFMSYIRKVSRDIPPEKQIQIIELAVDYGKVLIEFGEVVEGMMTFL
jgi:predicted nucleic acid-binding protein